MVQFEGSLIVFAVGLLVGGLAIHLGATLALESRNYTHAVVTAAMGSIAWWLVGLAFEELAVAPGSLASLFALVVWVGVLKHRYGTGWIRAALIGAFAWVAAVVVLALLSAAGVGGVRPYGIP